MPRHTQHFQCVSAAAWHGKVRVKLACATLPPAHLAARSEGPVPCRRNAPGCAVLDTSQLTRHRVLALQWPVCSVLPGSSMLWPATMWNEVMCTRLVCTGLRCHSPCARLPLPLRSLLSCVLFERALSSAFRHLYRSMFILYWSTTVQFLVLLRIVAND